MCVITLKSSHRPDGKNADALASTLALHNWECFGQLQEVRAAETFKSSHCPMGKMLTRLLRLSLCTTGNASVNYSMYVPQRPSKVPIAPMGKCLTLMGFSHASCFVLSGWRWLCLWRHGDLLIVHHHWQHSWLCACSSSKLPWDASLCSKVPIAPMGNC